MTWHPSPEAQRLLQAERGTIRREWGGRLPIALAFPSTYHVAMSSLAVHLLYRLWNARDDLVCERIFAPPLSPASLESGAPLGHFPVIAFSVSYELDYFRVVDLLRSSGIPPRAADRDDLHPLVIAGGPAVSANPEPLAPVLDAVLVGEIEPVGEALTDALRQAIDGRDRALDALARVPGVYLPNRVPGPPHTPVVRQWLHDLELHPARSIVLTPHTEFPDMGLIEIARGCSRGCRFCLAGRAYYPARERSVGSILAQARSLLLQTDRLGLVGAAVSDHSEIDRLSVELRRLGARVSVSSVRVDRLSEPLIRALSESGTRTLTIAPEAGSERLRRAIHKTQTEEDIMRAVEMASRYGFGQLKLYFMVGLPTEEPEDLRALADLALACSAHFRRQVTANVTPFVPKAHTPFQRVQQLPARETKRRLGYVEQQLRRQGIAVRSESPAWSEVQGTLARGDRRVGEALLASRQLSVTSWKQALGEIGISVEALLAARPAPEPLPWGFIRYGQASPRRPADSARQVSERRSE